MRKLIASLAILAIIGTAVVAVAANASSTSIPTVKIHCAYIQGGHGVSLGDLNVRRAGAVKRFCFVGKRGLRGAQGEQGVQGERGATGATGPQGPAGPAGADGQDANVGVQVCASNGGPLFLCDSPSGKNKTPVGYLVALP